MTVIPDRIKFFLCVPRVKLDAAKKDAEREFSSAVGRLERGPHGMESSVVSERSDPPNVVPFFLPDVL